MANKRKFEIDYERTLAALPQLNRDLREIRDSRFAAFTKQIEQNRDMLVGCIVKRIKTVK